MRTWARMAPRPIAPPPWACDLVDDAVRGKGDGSGLAHIVLALDIDDLTPDVRLLLPYAAGLLADRAPGSQWAPILRGVARRAAVTRSIGIGLAQRAQQDLAGAGVPSMAVGDLAAALAGGSGSLATARLLVPPDCGSLAKHCLSKPVEQAGVRLIVAPAFAATFALPAALAALWEGRPDDDLRPEPEFLLFEAIATASLGAPAASWYLAAARLGGLDWDRVAEHGRRFAWSGPVTEANQFLQERGWPVPRLTPGRGTVIDLAARSRRTGAARKPLLAARLLRHGGPAAVRLARQS